MLLFRILTVLFALLLVVIIMTANYGQAQEIFGLIYAIPYGDKFAHFILLGTLSMLISLGFSVSRTRFFSLNILTSSFVLACIITIEEFSQAFLRNRNFSLMDLAADYAGIFLMGELGAYLRGVMTGRVRKI